MVRLIAATLANGARAVGRAIPVLLVDAIGLTGVGLIAYGAWLVAPAAGFIAGGSLLLAGAVLATLGRRPRGDRE